ncbi:MAG: hypothetical protein ABR591_05885 [Candidatus Velthaea sp.]
MIKNIIELGANLEALSFSRPVESSADQKGGEHVRASRRTFPGMVWLFQRTRTASRT